MEFEFLLHVSFHLLGGVGLGAGVGLGFGIDFVPGLGLDGGGIEGLVGC